MKQENWLDEMMDAALEDFREERSEPDFPAIRLGAKARSTNPGRSSRGFLLAAAALILVFPGAFILSRRISTMQMMGNENRIFVQELLGGTIFEEGLEPMEPWYPEELFGDGLFMSPEDV